MLVDRPDICLKDDVLRRCGTDDFAEPPEMGWPPIGPAHIADIVPEQEGCAPKCRGLEIAQSIFASPAQITHGFVFDFGDRDQGEIPQAHQAGELHSVTAVGFHPVAHLFGN